eukprot:12659840-Heterocapsa_arctica.AAC.1
MLKISRRTSCYACGTSGHRAADCRRVLAFEEGEQERNYDEDTVESIMPPYDEEKNWVMEIGEAKK